MKTIISTTLVIILLSGIISSCEKVTVDEPEQLNYFMKLYGNYFSDRLNGIDIAENERILIAGDRTLEEGELEGWLIITDKEGMVVNEKAYNLNNDVRVLGTHTGINNYFVACEINPTGLHNGWVLVYDETMEMIDSLDFSIDIEAIKGVEFLKKSGQTKFLLHGNNGNTDEILIYEIVPNSSVQLMSRNEIYGELNGRLYVFEGANDTLYLAGSVPEVAGATATDVKSNILVSCLHNDNLLWSYSHGEYEVSELCSGIVYINNQLLIGGAQKISDEHHFANELFIYELDHNGQLYATQIFTPKGQSRAYEMLLNGNDELVWTGERKIDERNIRIFMARTTLNGQVILETEYGDRGYSSGRRITKLPGIDQGFLLSGILSTSGVSNDANDVLVIKVDKNGDWIQ
jgi:hypothetical protein